MFTLQDELSGILSLIDLSTNVIPYFRFQLPLVNETRRGALQHEARIQANQPPRVRVDIQQNLGL